MYQPETGMRVVAAKRMARICRQSHPAGGGQANRHQIELDLSFEASRSDASYPIFMAMWVLMY